MSRIAASLALVLVSFAPSLSGADGLDPAFGRNGVTLPELTLPDGTWASFVSVDSSGRVLLTGAGENNPGGALACLLPDGRFDASFGDAGVFDLADGLRAQRARFGPSDRIVVSYKDRVVLLDRNGIPDWSFGIRKDGVALIPGSGELLDAQEGPHGSIVGLLATRVCGPTGGGCRPAGALFKLRADGTPDSSFGTAGRVELDLEVYSFAVSSPGRVLVVGRSGPSVLALARRLSDGAPDPSFGAGGITSMPALDGAGLARPAAAPDGSLVLAGSIPDTLDSNRSTYLAVRLDRDGRPDPAFGTRGEVRVVVAVPPGPPSLALSSRGEVLLAGSPVDADRKLGTCVRFGPDGSLDPGFGEAGIFSIDTAPGYRGRFVTEVVVAPDGRILVAGSVSACDRWLAAAVRLSPDGLDGSFGDSGVAIADLRLSRGFQAFRVWIYPAAGGGAFLTLRSVAAGEPIQIIRIGRDGSLDPTYGRQGRAIVSFEGCPTRVDPGGSREGWVLGAAPDRRGRLVTLLQLDALDVRPEGTDAALVRLTEAGEVDREFGSNGRLDLSGVGGARALHLSVLSDSSVLVAFVDDDASRLILLSVGEDGRSWLQVSVPAPFRVQALALDQKGRILLAGTELGEVPESFVLLRILPDGRRDSSFGDGGLVRTSLIARGDWVEAVAFGPDGSVAVGALGYPAGGRKVAMARFDDEGRVVPLPGGFDLLTPTLPQAMYVATVHPQQGGRLLVLGALLKNGLREALILRFLPDGQPDPSFGQNGSLQVIDPRSGLWLIGDVLAAAAAEPGRVLLAGRTSPWGGYLSWRPGDDLFVVGLAVEAPAEGASAPPLPATRMSR